MRLEARNFEVISAFIPFTAYEKPASQNKWVGVLNIAFGPEMFSGLSRNRTLLVIDSLIIGTHLAKDSSAPNKSSSTKY